MAASHGQETGEKKDITHYVKEVRFGISDHDIDSFWATNQKEDGADIDFELIFDKELIRFLSGTASPNLGVSLNTMGGTSRLYTGFIHQWEFENRFFFNTGLGIALHNGELDDGNRDTKALGARILFRIPLEAGYGFNKHHRISISFDHISNADLALPNPGMDSIGILYGYRF